MYTGCPRLCTNLLQYHRQKLKILNVVFFKIFRYAMVYNITGNFFFFFVSNYLIYYISLNIKWHQQFEFINKFKKLLKVDIFIKSVIKIFLKMLFNLTILKFNKS